MSGALAEKGLTFTEGILKIYESYEKYYHATYHCELRSEDVAEEACVSYDTVHRFKKDMRNDKLTNWPATQAILLAIGVPYRQVQLIKMEYRKAVRQRGGIIGIDITEMSPALPAHDPETESFRSPPKQVYHSLSKCR